MASRDVTRLALVGYGRIAPQHLKVFRALGCDIVASCNRSEAGRAKASDEGGIANTYASIPEMVDNEKPDGIVCCASFDQMAGAAREILPLGIPTLLEKPPGISVAETAELAELADRHGTPTMVALNRRQYSVIRQAVADAGGFESITAVFVDWSEDARAFLENGFSVEQASKLIFANSLHGLDLLTFLAGAVPDPQVLAHNVGGPLRWMMSLQGVSARGALVSFQSTWDSPGRWRVAFCCPGRRYTFAPLETCTVGQAGTRETRSIEPEPCDQEFEAGFHRQASTFLETIATGQVPQDCSIGAALPAMTLAETLTEACLRAGQ